MSQNISVVSLDSAREDLDKLQNPRTFIWKEVSRVTAVLYYGLEAVFNSFSASGSAEKEKADLLGFIKRAGRTGDKYENIAIDDTMKLLDALPENAAGSDRTEWAEKIKELRENVIRGTMLQRRTETRRAQHERYNLDEFLRMIFGENHELMMADHPKEYKALHPETIEFYSGEDKDEEGNSLEDLKRKLAESYGYCSAFTNGRNLDEFENTTGFSPGDHFISKHTYDGSKRPQEIADELNFSIYKIWLADSYERLANPLAQKLGRKLTPSESRSLLKRAAAELSFNYRSWLLKAPNVYEVGPNTISLPMDFNARMFNLATGYELGSWHYVPHIEPGKGIVRTLEEIDEKEAKRKEAKVFKPGQEVILPDGTTATVTKTIGDSVEVNAAGNVRTLKATSLTSAVMSSKVPSGVPCLKETLEAKKKELEYIRNVAIPENTKAIAKARELGDLRENSEYQYARDKERELNNKAAHLENEINRTVVLDESSLRFGKEFTYTDLDTGKTKKITLLGPWEANGDSIINCQSPLGIALWNLNKNEETTIKVGDNYRRIRLEDIGPSPLFGKIRKDVGSQVKNEVTAERREVETVASSKEELLVQIKQNPAKEAELVAAYAEKTGLGNKETEDLTKPSDSMNIPANVLNKTDMPDFNPDMTKEILANQGRETK